MAEPMNVAAMPKTASFQMRINPEVKQRAEEIFARCGLTLTDAVNMAELKRGEDSVHSEGDWVSEDEMLAEFAGPA